MAVDGRGVCRACRSAEQLRRKGVGLKPRRLSQESLEQLLLAQFAPIRRAWVREFLDTAYRHRTDKTRSMFLRALSKFDAFVTEYTSAAEAQWTLLTVEHVEGYLAAHGRLRLETVKQFFRWLRSRKKTARLVAVLPPRPHRIRLRLLPVEQVLASFRQWTSDNADPRVALVGLLALVHCLRNGEIRRLRLADVIGADRLQVGNRSLQLAAPVTVALERYMNWRAQMYGGPSTYLLVSRASRLHDRPVSSVWFQYDLLDGVAISSLRQSAIRQLVQAVECDGLQVAAYTGLSLGAASGYINLFRPPA